MSIILAIETSAEVASVALLNADRMTSRVCVGVQTHSQSVLPMVQALLHEAGIRLAQCDAIGYGLGPGSFTGVRTACGITQGLAYGANLPVIPVVSLLAMAQACHAQSGATEVLAVLDARMGEVYWAQYRLVHDWQEIVAPTLSAPAEIAPIGAVQACGNGLLLVEQSLPAAFLANALPRIMPHAEQIASLAAHAFAHGQTRMAADAQPLYLRNKIALTTSERLAKASA